MSDKSQESTELSVESISSTVANPEAGERVTQELNKIDEETLAPKNIDLNNVKKKVFIAKKMGGITTPIEADKKALSQLYEMKKAYTKDLQAETERQNSQSIREDLQFRIGAKEFYKKHDKHIKPAVANPRKPKITIEVNEG